MKILMIRHGATKGNDEKRYVGSTDESITKNACEALVRLREHQSFLFEGIDIVYASPLKRCVETGNVLFPNNEIHLIDGFRECNFGEFEYHNYQELNGLKDYQDYIDSFGECGFPGGESRKEFQARCVKSFQCLMDSKYVENEKRHIAMVVHGGTVMALLDAFSVPHRDYFDWQVMPGHGYKMEIKKDGDSYRLENIVKVEDK